MKAFVGRVAELASLGELLDEVRQGRGPRPGRAVAIRGRRQVGKSLLAEVFCERAGVPFFYFLATGQPSVPVELDRFVRLLSSAAFPNARIARNSSPRSWLEALELLADVLPRDQPSIVVIDELPYLVAQDPGFEGALQAIWDRQISPLPVLLLLVGSDLSMMEALGSYDRPFYRRAREMVLRELNPADVQGLTGLPAPAAFDAYLITGGLPVVCIEWRDSESVTGFLRRQFAQAISVLLVGGERTLSAEFPAEAQAAVVLRTIGCGERTFGDIARRAGGLPPGSLLRSLDLLRRKRVVAADTPLSVRPSKETRYRVSDPALRFWLRFGEPAIPEAERGRPDLAMERFEREWRSWRGRAIEPVVREALNRLLPDDQFPDVREVGGWWNRANNPEVDLVGADRAGVAERVLFVGSIKWREDSAFDADDFERLAGHRMAVPGTTPTTPLVAVSRAGAEVDGLAAVYRPEDLIGAWK
ncbi:MAG: ATP-binding protein [Mycobacteriales bacterium]